MTGPVSVGDPYLIPQSPVSQTPGQIVGASPQWADNSDATYAEETVTWDETGSRGDIIAANLALDSTPTGVLNSLTLTMRSEVSAAVETINVLLPSVLLVDQSVPFVYNSVGRFDHYLTTWDTPETVVYDPADLVLFGSNTMSSVGALIASGNAALWVTAQHPLGIGQWNRIRVYELSLEAVYLTRNPPPLRRYPRSDGLGVGPRRHYPPPKSRRHAGGYN